MRYDTCKRGVFVILPARLVDQLPLQGLNRGAATGGCDTCRHMRRMGRT